MSAASACAKDGDFSPPSTARSRLPSEAQIPHFFGGPEPHEVPRTPDGDLDLLAMMRAIADD